MAYVTEVTKRVEHYNPISGHRWATYEPTSTFEVVGKWGFRQKFKSEAKANAEAKELTAFEEKFPWTPPRSERESAKARRA